MNPRPSPETFITLTSKEPDGSERIISGRVGHVEIENILVESEMFAVRPYHSATSYTLKAQFVPDGHGNHITVKVREKDEPTEPDDYSIGFLDGYAAALRRAEE